MNFNSINNFNNINFANQKAGIVQNNTEQATKQSTQTQAQPQALQQKQTINPSLMYDFALAKMDNETMLKYLQSLMKLPNSIEKFVSQLGSKNIDPKISSILIENMISVKVLSEFLNQNSTEAISKLMQTISSSLKSGISDVSQLKELLAILGTIQSATSINTNSIKELLLLYIPLNAPVFDKNINEKFQNEEEEQAIKNSKLSILFETINFSNLSITINESENNLYIDVYSTLDFPKTEFIRITQALSKEANIVSLIDFKEKQKAEAQNENQNFKILSDGFISPNALLLAHIVIKTILKIDSEFNSI